MKDYNNKNINVGDKVLVCEGHGRNAGASFQKAVVVSLTERMVRVTPLVAGVNKNLLKTYLKSPEKLFVTDEI